jgi:hypothetical protein
VYEPAWLWEAGRVATLKHIVVGDRADQHDHHHDESMSRWCTWQLSLSLTEETMHASSFMTGLAWCMDSTVLVHGTELHRGL